MILDEQIYSILSYKKGKTIIEIEKELNSELELKKKAFGIGTIKLYSSLKFLENLELIYSKKRASNSSKLIQKINPTYEYFKTLDLKNQTEITEYHHNLDICLTPS